jgi:hypothetical protein
VLQNDTQGYTTWLLMQTNYAPKSLDNMVTTMSFIFYCMPHFSNWQHELSRLRLKLENTLGKKIPLVADEIQRFFGVLGLILIRFLIL